MKDTEGLQVWCRGQAKGSSRARGSEKSATIRLEVTIISTARSSPGFISANVYSQCEKLSSIVSCPGETFSYP